MDMNFPHGRDPQWYRGQDGVQRLRQVSYGELIALSHRDRSYRNIDGQKIIHGAANDTLAMRINLLSDDGEHQPAKPGSFLAPDAPSFEYEKAHRDDEVRQKNV